MPVRGKEAMAVLLEQAKKSNASKTLDLQQIQTLSSYDFLLDKSENELVQSWMEEIWKSAGLAGATAVQEARRPAATTTSAAQKPKKMDSANATAIDNIADLFA